MALQSTVTGLSSCQSRHLYPRESPGVSRCHSSPCRVQKWWVVAVHSAAMCALLRQSWRLLRLHESTQAFSHRGSSPAKQQAWMVMAWPSLLRSLLMLAHQAGRKPVAVQPTMQPQAAAPPWQPGQTPLVLLALRLALRRHLCARCAVWTADQNVPIMYLAKQHHLLKGPRASKAIAMKQTQMS